jgi:hypothetical protein
MTGTRLRLIMRANISLARNRHDQILAILIYNLAPDWRKEKFSRTGKHITICDNIALSFILNLIPFCMQIFHRRVSPVVISIIIKVKEDSAALLVL